jgi:hypothetical protein
MTIMSIFTRTSARSTTILRIVTLLIGAWLVPALAMGQTFVQVNSNPTAVNTATVTVSYLTPETAGHLNVVVVGWSDPTSSVVSVVDDNTNVYKLAGTTAGHGLSQAIYYASNIVLPNNTSPTITVTFNQVAAFPDVRILEYSGLSATTPLDNWTGLTGNSTVADSTSAATTGNDLILGAGTTGAAFTAAGTGFTSRVITTAFGDIVEDSAAALPAGSYNATATLNTGIWAMQVAAFSTTPITHLAPVIDPVTPISRTTGPSTGGTQLTIFGTNFSPGAVVIFGTGLTAFSALNCAEEGGTSISCFTPAHLAGVVDVTVVNVDGQSSTSAGAYTYVVITPPTFASVLPTTGPTNGGTAITLTGTLFQTGATVALNGLPAANVAVVSSTSITATTPALPAGIADITVTNPDGGTITGPDVDGFTYAAGTGPINYVQGVTAASGGIFTSVPATLPNPQGAGNLNVVIVGWSDTVATVSSVTDTEGNTYTVAASPQVGTGLTQVIYYAKNIVGETGTPNQITVAFSQAAQAPDVRVLEYSGLSITSPVDTTAGDAGSSALADTGVCATTTPVELVVAGATVANSVSGPGAGFTLTSLTRPNGDNSEHLITAAIGSCEATAPVVAGNWVIQAVAFKLTPDFTLNATALTPASVAAGSSATSTVSVAPLNGFTTGVALSCSITPVVASPPTCAFVPTSIPGGTGNSALTVNTTAATPAGGYTVTVNGVGSVTHTKALSMTVTAAAVSDFTMTAGALAPTTIAPGAASTSTITIAPVNGFTAAVALTCTVAPSATRGPTCAFNPASVTGGTGTSVLTVSTTAATTSSLERRSRGIFYAMLLPIAGLALLGTGFTSRKKRFFGFLLGCLLFSTLIILPACGGSSSSGGGGGGHPGTPAGTYTVTVTGTSGSTTHTATASVTVN